MSPHQDSSNRNRGAYGFTLVEALVALALLTVGLVPAFIQASSAIALAGSVRNNLVAASLAQEGMEVVRAIRDANWLATPKRAYDFGLSGPPCDVGCRVQWDDDVADIRPLSGNPILKLDPLSGLYQYSGPTDSAFTRKVVITSDSASPYRILVVVTMEWNERSGAKTFTLEDYLYDWLQ